MDAPNHQHMRQCVVDDSLELTPSEAGKHFKQVNVLLKASHLLGRVRDIDSAFQTIFDIAEEIAGVERCSYFSRTQDLNSYDVVASRHLVPPEGKRAAFLAPAGMAFHFGKAILIDSDKDPAFLPIRDAWQSASVLSFPLRVEREPVGALVFGKGKSHSFDTIRIKLLWALSFQAESILLQNEPAKALSFYSFLDPLTHLNNSRYFGIRLEKEISRSLRSGKPLALLMLDLGGLNADNDTFPHPSCDIALQEFASILQSSVRDVDTVARLGGGKFAVILVESDAFGAQDLARRITERFEGTLLRGMDHARTERLSASIGISTFPADSFDKRDLLNAADSALSLAKTRGRGKVALYQDISEILSLQSPPGEIPIQKIYGAARSVVDTDGFLEIVFFTAMKGLEAERGSIIVVDPGGNHCLRTAIGFPVEGERPVLPGTVVTPGSVTSWVLEHKTPLVVSGNEDMPVPREMKKNGYSTDSFLSIPLMVEGRLLGVLHLTNRMSRQAFTREDLASFDPIARQIASILSQGLEFRENVKRFSTSIFFSISSALELRFPFLSGHSERVQDYCLRVGRRLGLGEEEMCSLGTAASLHDIGIVGIPGAILSKNRKLTDREMEVTRKHPFLAYKLMEGVPGLEDARRFILEHHEFVNGSGYPFGLRGEEISRGARILALAEYFDSITSERPHRGGLRHEEAIQLVRNNRETLFDDVACMAFLEELHIP